MASHFPDRPLPTQARTFLEALRERLGAARVEYARGCGILRGAGDPLRVNPEAAQAGPDQAGLDLDRSGIAAAAELARGADVAIVVVGDRAGHFRTGTVGEGTDTDDLSLPGVQPELLDAVLGSGTPSVVVLVNGRPFALGDVAQRAAAILEAWFPGQDGADAIAAALVGDINPGGKTTLTFGPGAGVLPLVYDHKPLGRGIPPFPTAEPVFAFGHGLSYTRFDYSELAIGAAEVATNGEVHVGFELRNAGERAGDEVVQLYLRDPVASVTRPSQRLIGFRRVSLAAGEACRVSFRVPAELAAFTGRDLRRSVEPGRIELRIGASSADIRLEGGFELVGPARELGRERAFEADAHVERV